MSQDNRRGGRKRLVRIVVYAIVLLTVLGMVFAMVGTAWAASAPAPATGAPTSSTASTSAAAVSATSGAAPATAGASAPPIGGSTDKHPVVLLGTTDVSWADLQQAAAAGGESARLLLAAVGDAAPVNLVQRTASDRTCPADAWLTLGAGARTRAVPAASSAEDCTWPTWSAAAAESLDSGYGAEPGALADALASHGVSSTAVGRGADLALTDATGQGADGATTLSEGVSAGLPSLTLVDLSDPKVAAELASAPVLDASTGSTASPTRAAGSEGSGTTSTAVASAEAPAETTAAEILTALTWLPSEARVVIASLADPSTPGLQAAVLPAGTGATSASAASTASGAVVAGGSATTSGGTLSPTVAPAHSAALPVSPSTHRKGLLQIADLTATLAQSLTGEVPTAMTGGALELPETAEAGLGGLTVLAADGSVIAGRGEDVAASVSVSDAATDRVDGLVDDALRARASRASTLPVSLTIVLAALVLLLAASQVLRGPRGRSRLHGTAVVATLVAALPGGAWLASSLPWWRLGAVGDAPSRWSSFAALGATILLAAVLAGVLHGAARAVTAHRDRRLTVGAGDPEVGSATPSAPSTDRTVGATRPPDGVLPAPDPTAPDAVPADPPLSTSHSTDTASPGAPAADAPVTLDRPAPRALPNAAYLTALLLALVTPALILVDAALGAPLAFNGVLGMDAVIAGRFYGVSNTAFALAAAALVVGLGAAAGPWVAAQETRRARRRAALLVVLAPGVLALLVDGLPGLGADVGGAITLVAVLITLATTLAGGRIGWKRWLSIGVMAVATVGLFGLIDHATGSRTHLGHFIGRLQNGTAGTTILRKATAVIAPFLSNVLAAMALVVAAALVATLVWWLGRERRAWQVGRSGYAPLVRPDSDPTGAVPSAPSEADADDDGDAGGAAVLETGDASPAGVPWAGPVPRGTALVPEWFAPVVKSLGVLIVIEVLVNDSGASMAVLSAVAAAPLLLALVAARLAGEPGRR